MTRWTVELRYNVRSKLWESDIKNGMGFPATLHFTFQGKKFSFEVAKDAEKFFQATIQPTLSGGDAGGPSSLVPQEEFTIQPSLAGGGAGGSSALVFHEEVVSPDETRSSVLQAGDLVP